MLLSHIHSWVDKESLTLRYPPNFNICLVLQFKYQLGILKKLSPSRFGLRLQSKWHPTWVLFNSQKEPAVGCDTAIFITYYCINIDALTHLADPTYVMRLHMLLSTASTHVMLWIWNLGPPFEDVAYPLPLWKRCVSNIYIVYRPVEICDEETLCGGSFSCYMNLGFAQAFVDLDCKANLSLTHSRGAYPLPQWVWPIVQSKLAYKFEFRFPWREACLAWTHITRQYHLPLPPLLWHFQSLTNKWCIHALCVLGARDFVSN